MPLGILRKSSEGNKSLSNTEQKVKKSEFYLYDQKSHNCSSKEKQNLSYHSVKSRTKSLSLILCIKNQILIWEYSIKPDV